MKIIFDLLSSFIDSFRNPEWARFAVFFIVVGSLCIVATLITKVPFFGNVGYSKEARGNRVKLFWLAVFLMILSCVCIVLASSGKGDNDFLKGKETTEDRLPNPNDELSPKGIGFYNDKFPIVNIPRKCLPTKFHEYENYTLIAGDFDNDTLAMEVKKAMDYFNIKNQGHFTLRCNPDDVYGIEGKYLLFVGRNFTSLNSAKNKKKKYEDIFRNNEYWTNLRIVKFEDY